jgi:NAD(P)-dependent dehydrogenase (short-subunit alcohol dehydrogenase family)
MPPLTGSIATVKGIPAFGVYSASKAAIRSFVRTWTLELKDRKIRANVISLCSIQQVDRVFRVIAADRDELA